MTKSEWLEITDVHLPLPDTFLMDGGTVGLDFSFRFSDKHSVTDVGGGGDAAKKSLWAPLSSQETFLKCGIEPLVL